MSRPVLTIIAGSNGCGKSTLTRGAREEFQQNPVLDPDAIAKSLQATYGSPSNIEAGKQVLRIAEELIENRQSFTVETTLSGGTYLRMADRAKRAGFDIRVFFIGTTSVEINIERVKARVRKGGHDVPEEDQRRRYPRTLANMKKLLPSAGFAGILDNSTPKGHTVVGYGVGANMHWIEPLPDWAAGLRT
ncbi:Predicted ABC-type ATPase [Granulicella pectinivorans]|uniref:Predicted ABC-type ATPase n=1 Tax=Granulicella pectinivorans TaxID=474950 RepID=A0A1I6M891_9BACT|nr:zeta toxin family protein [Granulicella pectinivorans]SFS11935.1 Predicted ABC-type ATPase [Granulicella pectinivorans]